MRKPILIMLGLIAGFVLLCFMFPGKRQSHPVELCGAARELKAATGASRSDREYHDLACNHDLAQQGYDALYKEQHGQ